MPENVWLNQHIPALKYGRDMEQHALNAFLKFLNAVTKGQGYVIVGYS